MKTNVQFNVKLPFKITKRSKWVLASCPVLDVHSQGETEKQAKENLIEALSLFIISCFERGTLEAVFKECGFEVIKLPSKSKLKDENYLEVPIPFLVNQANRECHV